MSIGVDTYTLPALCKAVHTVRVAGDRPRSLIYIGRRLLNKAHPNQTIQYSPYAYDLFRSESEGGKLRLVDIPNSAEPFVVDYYRQMVVPCYVTGVSVQAAGTGVYTVTVNSAADITVGSMLYNTSTATAISSTILGGDGTEITGVLDVDSITIEDGWDGGLTQVTGCIVGGDNMLLDCPADYQDSILAMATYKYLINKSSGGNRLQYWQGESGRLLEEAIAVNKDDTPDEEILFLPPYYYDNINLSPNDIRWADMSW